LLRASVALTGCAYLAVLSASRAALGGIAVLFFLLVFSNPRVIIVASLAAIGLMTIGGPVTSALDNVQTRVSQDRHPKTSFIEERGYDRLWEHNEYLLFGAGEGDVQRFRDTPTSPGEVHSSFATVLFSYGIIGMIAFALFLWRVVRGASLRASVMLLPTLSYTLAHNGLRFTMLWVLLALFVALKVPAPRERAPLGQLA
jgi:O-Antigen ligase